MNKCRFVMWFLLVVSVLAITDQILVAGDANVPGVLARRGNAASKERIDLPAMPEVSRRLVGARQTEAWPAGAAQQLLFAGDGDRLLHTERQCRQIVVNSQLDVKEFGPGTGTAEPWFFLEPIIYYFEEGDGNDLAYDGYSLVLPDGDTGDPSPKTDILVQVVEFGDGLSSVTVAYQRAMLDSNSTDEAFGELWLLTEDDENGEGGGELDLENPDEYRLTRWRVTDSNDAWKKESVKVDGALLGQLSGQEIALLLRTETNGGGASEAEKEWVLFDDITIDACSDFHGVYLPVVRSN